MLNKFRIYLARYYVPLNNRIKIITMKKILLGLSLVVGSVTANAQSGPVTEICIATPDVTLSHNIIVWERASQTSAAPIDSIRIYYMDVTGADVLIGTVDYDSLSLFEHFQADINLRSWTYKIQGVDINGLVGPKSTSHSTIHLSVQNTTGVDPELIWTPYVGNTISTYECWSDSLGIDDYELVNQVSSSAAC